MQASEVRDFPFLGRDSKGKTLNCMSLVGFLESWSVWLHWDIKEDQISWWDLNTARLKTEINPFTCGPELSFLPHHTRFPVKWLWRRVSWLDSSLPHFCVTKKTNMEQEY